MDKKTKNWLLALEAERWDISYRKPDAKPPVKVRIQAVMVPMTDEADKKLYFNAGRYAAGARDSIATLAWLELQDEFDQVLD